MRDDSRERLTNGRATSAPIRMIARIVLTKSKSKGICGESDSAKERRVAVRTSVVRRYVRYVLYLAACVTREIWPRALVRLTHTLTAFVETPESWPHGSHFRVQFGIFLSVHTSNFPCVD